MTHNNNGHVDLQDGFATNAVGYENTYSTTLFGEKAVDVVQDHDLDKPLFLYVAWNAIHSHVSVPEDFKSTEMYQRLSSEIFGSAEERQELSGAAYYVSNETENIVNALKVRVSLFRHD